MGVDGQCDGVASGACGGHVGEGPLSVVLAFGEFQHAGVGLVVGDAREVFAVKSQGKKTALAAGDDGGGLPVVAIERGQAELGLELIAGGSVEGDVGNALIV